MKDIVSRPLTTRRRQNWEKHSLELWYRALKTLSHLLPHIFKSVADPILGNTTSISRIDFSIVMIVDHGRADSTFDILGDEEHGGLS